MSSSFEPGSWSDDDVKTASTRLAVYGTLAPGRKNHWALANLEGRWFNGHVRGHRVASGWGNTDGFPAFQPDSEGGAVEVAVFESPSLPAQWPRLDAFEGSEYARVIVEVEIEGQTLLTNIYACAVLDP